MSITPGLVTPENVVFLTALSKGGQPNNLHHAMFEVSIRYLGDDEQNKKWLEQIQQNRIIGSYGQTELAHGSNVRGLETTATLDKETDSWIINSPSI